MKNNRTFSLPFFIVLSSFVLSSCFMPQVLKDEKILFEQSIQNNPAIKKSTMELDGDTLFYALAGDPSKASLIIIHGTPGSWEQYARYLLDEILLDRFQVVVIDRPGWGQSVLGGNRPIASFAEQAKLISALAVELKKTSNGEAVILMGHSLGASIAPRVAMDFPEAIDGLLLFAGTLDPQLADPRWFNRFAKWSIVKSIIGDRMNNSNLEILALKNEMEMMSGQWQSMKAKTIVVQGMEDALVYPENIQFAETALNKETSLAIRLNNDGHLFPMKRREEVALWASCLLESINKELLMCDRRVK